MDQAEGERMLSSPTFLFYLDLQWIGWGALILGKTICFTQFTDPNNLFWRDLRRHTQMMFSWISAYLAQSVDT